MDAVQATVWLGAAHTLTSTPDEDEELADEVAPVLEALPLDPPPAPDDVVPLVDAVVPPLWLQLETPSATVTRKHANRRR